MIKIKLPTLIIAANLALVSVQFTLSCFRAGDINRVQNLEQQLNLLISENLQLSTQISSLSSIPSISQRAIDSHFIASSPVFVTPAPIVVAMKTNPASP